MIMLYTFCHPTLISFMGIPGSGKTTLAKALGKKFPSTETYLECEEDQYPVEIKKNFENRDLFGYLAVFNFFRNMRVASLMKAYQRKLINQSSILDCYFDKLMNSILTKDNIDWFINSRHPDYQEILNIAHSDQITLPDVDVLIFLKLSEETHQQFQKQRNRKADMNPKVFYSQEAFLSATEEYCIERKIKFFLVEQSQGINKTLETIFGLLEKEKLIKPHASDL